MSTSIYQGSILRYFEVNRIENEIFLHLTNPYLNVEFERRFRRPKKRRRASKDGLMKTPPSWITW